MALRRRRRTAARHLRLEALEERQLLAHNGLLLPVADLVPVPAVELQADLSLSGSGETTVPLVDALAAVEVEAEASLDLGRPMTPAAVDATLAVRTENLPLPGRSEDAGVTIQADLGVRPGGIDGPGAEAGVQTETRIGDERGPGLGVATGVAVSGEGTAPIGVEAVVGSDNGAGTEPGGGIVGGDTGVTIVINSGGSPGVDGSVSVNPGPLPVGSVGADGNVGLGQDGSDGGAGSVVPGVFIDFMPVGTTGVSTTPPPAAAVGGVDQGAAAAAVPDAPPALATAADIQAALLVATAREAGPAPGGAHDESTGDEPSAAAVPETTQEAVLQAAAPGGADSVVTADSLPPQAADVIPPFTVVEAALEQELQQLLGHLQALGGDLGGWASPRLLAWLLAATALTAVAAEIVRRELRRPAAGALATALLPGEVP